ncbi:MAG: PAS domain S-box protein [Chromatiaceae bacterium]|nr:PAS domain S-box protein [Chromatiaceae bacterium]
MPCDLLANPATWDLLSKTGQAYFDALMEYLVKVLGVNLAFTVESVAPSGTRVCPVASWGEVGLRGGRCYDTRGTPCERLGQGQNGIYPDRLAERFPADSWVVQSGMRSYVGVPLLDAEGHPLGHLGVLDHRPMADPQAVAATLAAFALRCAAELGRARQDRGLERQRRARQDQGLERFVGHHAWVLYRATPPRFAAAITTPDGQDFLGFSAVDLRECEDLRGRQLHEPDRERVLATFAGAYESGEDFVIQYRLWDKEREVLRRFQDYGHIERDSQGRPTAITGVLVDITVRVASDGAVDGFVLDLTEQEEARRALAESEQRFRGICATAQDAILMLDERGHIVFWNAAATRIFGYTEEEALGHDAHLLLTPARLRGKAVQGMRAFARTGEGPVLGKTVRLDALRKDGAELPVELSVSALRIHGRWHAVGVVRDITAQEETLAAARESEARFRVLFEQAADGLLIADPLSTRFIAANHRMAEMLGYRVDELAELSVADIHPPEALPRTLMEFHRLATAPQSQAMDIPVLRRDGSVFTANVTSFQIRHDGKACLVGAFRDVSEMKAVEARVRGERRLLRTYLDNAPVITLMFDVEGRVQLINQRGCELIGRAPDEVVGRNWFEEYVAEDDRARARQAFQNCLTNKPGHCGTSEYTVATPGGGERRIAWLSNVVSDAAGATEALLVSGEDVTERRQIERELCTARERLAFVANTTPVVLFACAPGEPLRVTFASANLAEQFGIDPERILGRSGLWDEHVHPADLPAIAEAWPRLLETGCFEIEFRLRRNGGYRWAESELRLVRDAAGEPLEVVGYLLDVTGRKLAELALREREASLAYAQAIANVGSWETDLVAGNEQWSDEVFRILGHAPRAFQPSRERLLYHIHGSDVARFRGRMHEAIDSEAGFTVEFRVVRPSGEERFVRARGEIRRDERGTALRIIGTLLDITDRKRAEASLLKSQEQLRELAGHLQMIREEERALLARELHDEMGQALTAMNIDLVRLRGQIKNPVAAATALLESLLRSVDATIDSVQRIMTRLRPAILDDLGLVPAIEWQVGQFRKRTEIRCELVLPEVDIELSRDASTALFRILQESLTNVTRHAEAKRVSITLSQDDDWMSLEVKDDGKGISVFDLESSRSFGLMGIKWTPCLGACRTFPVSGGGAVR